VVDVWGCTPFFGWQDIEDIVPDNVTYNLELQAAPYWTINDEDDNHRWNCSGGEENGIYTMRFPTQNHTEIDNPCGNDGCDDEPGMGWIKQRLESIYSFD
jgi:hypothetical protein